MPCFGEGKNFSAHLYFSCLLLTLLEVVMTPTRGFSLTSQWLTHEPQNITENQATLNPVPILSYTVVPFDVGNDKQMTEIFRGLWRRSLGSNIVNSSYFDELYSRRSPRSVDSVVGPPVKVELQGFIFQIANERILASPQAEMHLTQLMKPYQHLHLEPQYMQHLITTYNPIVIQNQICKEFASGNEHVANSFFVVNDHGTFTDRPGHDRLHRLFFQISSALGIPSITWMPNRVGQFELDDSQLAIRLEPLAWHVSHALVDFLQAFKWNMVIVVYNVMVPGSTTLMEELRKRQYERSFPEHSNYFSFEITHENEFTGLSSEEFKECIQKLARKLVPCLFPLIRILDDIWHADAKVIIFNGNFFDLNELLYIADNLNNTEYSYLQDLFDEGYVWIFTPSAMNLMTNTNKPQDVDNSVLPEYTMFRRIPGMFGLMCFNGIEQRRRNAELAREIWLRSMIELAYQLTHIYPPKDLIQINSVNTETVGYFYDILKKLVPDRLCNSSGHSFWQWGKRMYRIMRSLEFTFKKESISILPNGGLNVSELHVYNSRITDGQMKWHKVGTWSLSSKLGKKKSHLQIHGVTWLGQANSPPKGRPNKFKVRVVTIKERPFVNYAIPQHVDGSCDANSLPCKLRPESIEALESLIVGSEKTQQQQQKQSAAGAANTNDVVTQSVENVTGMASKVNATYYVNGCCSGLTMDLLMELMKDLNLDVELFEVPDGLWGSWTPNGWNGLIRTLINNQADMAVTSLKITPNRSQQIEFSVPFMETGIAVAVALREGAISPTAFLKPYDYQSWCLILVVSVHASGLALFAFEWLSPNGLNRRQTREGFVHRFTVFRSLWLIWSMLFGAAVNVDNPRGVASRFLANLWALFALVFLASYTANLAAFMIAKEDFYELSGITDPRLQQPWSVKPPFRFATIPSGATEENVKINFPEMGVYMRKYNKSTVEEGLESMKAGQLDAFIYDARVLEYWAAKDEGCKLRTVGNLYAMTGYGIGFSRNSRWLEKVNSRILEYQKNGKFQRWKAYWQTGSCRRDAALGNTNKTLGVKNFISAFILLACGMLMCAIILLVEQLCNRKLRQRRVYCNPHMFSKPCPTLGKPESMRQLVSCNGWGCKWPTDNVQVGQTAESEVRRNTDPVAGGDQSGLCTAANHHTVGTHHSPLTTAPVNSDNSGNKRQALKSTQHREKQGMMSRHAARRFVNQERPHSSTQNVRLESTKHWDLYNKVAVIPIPLQLHPEDSPLSERHFSVSSLHQIAMGIEDDNHVIVLPKLNSSPNRRRRIFENTKWEVTGTTKTSVNPYSVPATKLGEGECGRKLLKRKGQHIDIDMAETYA